MITDDLRRSKPSIAFQNAALYNFNHHQVDSSSEKPTNQYQVQKVTTTATVTTTTTTTSTTPRINLANRKAVSTALPSLASKVAAQPISNSM